MNKPHTSVMPEEALACFDGVSLETFYEGTVGAGGHARLFLEAHPEITRYLACDRDEQALGIARTVLEPWKKKIEWVHGSFAHMHAQLNEKKLTTIDGCFFDLGVSSMQLDSAERGFSFMHDGPLDMRMDPTNSHETAADIVNTWPEQKLEGLFREYEERHPRRAAKAICIARAKKRFHTTKDLADVLKYALKSNGRRLHPATLVFQALRIHVNGELEAVKEGISQAIEVLRPGGRVGIITFHSLEDRIVKNIFRDASRSKQLRLLTKKPQEPTAREKRLNPRSRSAKMRTAEKL